MPVEPAWLVLGCHWSPPHPRVPPSGVSPAATTRIIAIRHCKIVTKNLANNLAHKNSLVITTKKAEILLLVGKNRVSVSASNQFAAARKASVELNRFGMNCIEGFQIFRD
jgi:hypothetical protein